MVSLNVGCGGDPYGDFRLDVRRKNTYANIIADAHFLPFKTNYFNYICVFDLLEHLESHPRSALGEFGRVCSYQGIIHIRTPSWHFYQLLIEVFAYPFRSWDRLKSKQNPSLLRRLKKIFNWKHRMVGNPNSTAFGGHQWFIPWGWKLYYPFFGILEKCWKGIHWKYESVWWKGKTEPDGKFALRLLSKKEVGYN